MSYVQKFSATAIFPQVRLAIISRQGIISSLSPTSIFLMALLSLQINKEKIQTKREFIWKIQRKIHIVTVVAVNGLVGKASVLPSASIRIYVLVVTVEKKKFDEHNDGRWSCLCQETRLSNSWNTHGEILINALKLVIEKFVRWLENMNYYDLTLCVSADECKDKF